MPLCVNFSNFTIHTRSIFPPKEFTLEQLIPNYGMHAYDELVLQLTQINRNPELLNEKWSNFYNTTLVDIWDKRGRGLAVLGEEK